MFHPARTVSAQLLKLLRSYRGTSSGIMPRPRAHLPSDALALKPLIKDYVRKDVIKQESCIRLKFLFYIFPINEKSLFCSEPFCRGRSQRL